MDIIPKTLYLKNAEIPYYTFDAIIIGSGCAGYNAADSLYSLGKTNIALITEGRCMGTSRNTGSDKQTYYKLSTSGNTPDSVMEMARDLHSGGMHGDNALAEAACSLECFFKLVGIGVPFPYNEYGEYVGYQTDNDTGARATSCGPLTSKFMTERLEAQVASKSIPVFDGYRVIKLIAENGRIRGALAITPRSYDAYGLTLFLADNIIYATGGPSGMFYRSVYPESQTGANGTAFEAGVRGSNLHLFQFGIASVGFRWNLSGSYQQVIPRYFSCDIDGNDEKEFLNEHFDSPGDMLKAVFLKGYQWPFDKKHFSSGVDLAVYNETHIKNRRVYMDFRKNPLGLRNLTETGLPDEVREYLEKSGALAFETPVERLIRLNTRAYEHYKNNGYDLERVPIEIDICVQHNNGGLIIDKNSESNIKGLFIAGEAAGVFGPHRPGGSALNSTQVTSLRAAREIARRSTSDIVMPPVCVKAAEDALNLISEISSESEDNTLSLRECYQRRMSHAFGIVSDPDIIETAIRECRDELERFNEKTRAFPQNLTAAFINRDILISQYVYLNALRHFFTVSNSEASADTVYETSFNPETYGCDYYEKETREIPDRELWFENVYNSFTR